MDFESITLSKFNYKTLPNSVCMLLRIDIYITLFTHVWVRINVYMSTNIQMNEL